MKNGKGRLTKGQKALKGIKELYTGFGYASNFKKKSCENCYHYNQDYPPPFCLNCKTGFNDNFRKKDYWKELTYQEIKEK